MARRSEEPKRFTLRMQKKLAVLFLFILLAFITLSVRLYAITRDDGAKYKRQVLSQRGYDSKTIPFRSGDILDRKELKLATSDKVYNVILDAKIIMEKEEKKPGTCLEPTISALSDCFGIDGKEVREYIAGNPSSSYKILKKVVSFEDKTRFLEMQKGDGTTATGISGVWFEDSYIRTYPYGSLAADVIGFARQDNVGMNGLEEYYNNTLNGSNGREYGFLNNDSNYERTLKPAIDGKTLVMSIDMNLQTIVEKHIGAFNKKHAGEFREGEDGSVNTGVVLMDPDNGEVLAMASAPGFDLNDPWNVEKVMTEGEAATASEEDKQNALYDLWKNFCVSYAFEPGSTMKPFTIAAGLESGKLLGNEAYDCQGLLEIGGWKIRCNNKMGHKLQTLSDAVANSCNVALMRVGEKIGKSTFMDYMFEFGFGLKTGIDLTGEPNTSTLIFKEETMTPTDLAIGSFGQGFNVTMIEMITSFCSLINGGYFYEPHVVTKVINSDKVTLQDIEPRVLKQTVSAETSRKIVEYLDNAVANGTGKNARPAGYTMGGKTGTAERYPRDKTNYVVSFIGYAPASTPEIAIYVVVDRPNVSKQDSASYAVEITKNILTEALPYLNIPVTETISQEEMEELSAFESTFSTSVMGILEDKVEEEEEEGQESQEEAEEEEEEEEETDNIQYDPETGYALDPETGEFLDPETGESIENTSDLGGAGSPVPQQEENPEEGTGVPW